MERERATAETTVLAEAIGRSVALLAELKSPGVRADERWAEAGRKVVRFHLARMIARVPGVISGEDPEDVHAMRVAVRRMRAAWRVFGDGFERPEARRYRGDLRVIGGALGAVRDMDVLLEIVDAYESARGRRSREGIAALRFAWAEEREARRVALLAHLGSDAFPGFLAEYEALATTRGLAARAVAPHAPDAVRTRIPAAVWAAYGLVRAFDDGLDGSDLVAMHELRIAGKSLRYTLEFAREAIGPEAPGLIAPVTALQDHLGAQHDLHVAATLARELLGGGRIPESEAGEVARFVAHLDDGVARHAARFPETWQPLLGRRYRALLGRGLGRL